MPPGHRRTARRAALAALVGGALEYYDYFVFATAAALVLDDLFFPRSTPLVGTLAAFAVFGVGFLARPAGSIVLGALGDRRGRRTVLVLTMYLMGIATVLIGLLPTAGQIGVLAPLLLVLLRLLQGFGVGGEWAGAALIAVEHAPPTRRAVYGTAAQAGVAVGAALAAGVFAAVQALTTAEEFLAWGWRIPFLLGVVLIPVGIAVRKGVSESPDFLALERRGERAAAPLREAVMKSNLRSVLLATGMRMSENVVGYVVLTFSIVYVTSEVDPHADYMPVLITVATVTGCGVYVLAGWAADRFGRKPVFLAGGVFALVFPVPFFALLDTGVPVLVLLALFLAWAVASGVQFGIEPAYFAELFGARNRFTGISLGFQLGTVLGGGFAPFIAVALLAAGQGSPVWVIVYLTAVAALSLLCGFLAPDPYAAQLRRAGASAS